MSEKSLYCKYKVNRDEVNFSILGIFKSLPCKISKLSETLVFILEEKFLVLRDREVNAFM